jgi:hypothetical protein
MVAFHLPCHWHVSPRLLGEVIPQDTSGWFDPEEELILLASWGEVLGCTMELGKVQEPARGVLPIRLVRTWVQILGLPLSGRREA